MASTNKTTHYELSQYVGSDKPTYLTDYNNDMSAIDSGIYTAQQKADSAYTLADTADGKADNAQTTANTAVTNAGTANNNIGTMANLNTTEKSNLVGAINEVNGRFDFTSFKTYDDLTDTTNVDKQSDYSFSTFNVTLARNSEGSIFKLYGQVRFTTTNTRDGYIILKNTGLNPTEAFTINDAGFVFDINIPNIYPTHIEVLSNGNLKLSWGNADAAYSRRGIYFPCVYFAKSFGDIPSD